MSAADDTYGDLLRIILDDGEVRTDRTGVGTKAIFGHQMRFDLAEEFPLLTTKRVFFRGVVEELLWFLRGETNIGSLNAAGVHIWDEWADASGELGPTYGAQWRAWPTFEPSYPANPHSLAGTGGNLDQIEQLIERLVENPDSRRHIVTAWNPGEVDQMKLPPCHCLFQFDVTAEGKLNCQLYQRSADVFLGLPFNIASYSLLTLMVAQVTGLDPGEFIWTGGNTHLYLNHLLQAEEQFEREGRDAPEIWLNEQVTNIFHFGAEDIHLVNYQPHPPIKAEVAI